MSLKTLDSKSSYMSSGWMIIKDETLILIIQIPGAWPIEGKNTTKHPHTDLQIMLRANHCLQTWFYAEATSLNAKSFGQMIVAAGEPAHKSYAEKCKT